MVNSNVKHTWIFVVIICILLIIITTFLIEKVGESKPAELYANSVGIPIVAKRGTDFLCAGIQQIVNDEQSLYVLYGNYGVVQAYDLNGTYLYTISLYNHQNGRFEIAVRDGCLYVSDKMDNLYIFKSGEFQAFRERDSAENIRKSIDFNENSKDYIVKGTSVWYIGSKCEEKCIVSRSPLLILFQKQLGFFLRLGLIIVIAILIYWKKH